MTRFMAAVAALLIVGAAQGQQVPYPHGYRSWHHVKTMIIGPGHPLYATFGGIHHLYANSTALEGYARGRFADGAVIVFDLLEARSADNAVIEGPRKIVGVMHKDAKRYTLTGGWGFEGFKGDTQTERAVDAEAVKACFECHAARKAHDYVFSNTRK